MKVFAINDTGFEYNSFCFAESSQEAKECFVSLIATKKLQNHNIINDFCKYILKMKNNSVFNTIMTDKKGRLLVKRLGIMDFRKDIMDAFNTQKERYEYLYDVMSKNLNDLGISEGESSAYVKIIKAFNQKSIQVNPYDYLSFKLLKLLAKIYVNDTYKITEIRIQSIRT